MTRVSRLTQTIRDVADAAGTAQPAALFEATRMDRHALVRAIGSLARRGLVTIDKVSGAVALTPAGRASLAEAGETIEAGAQARPAGYALLPDATAAAGPAARGGDSRSRSKRAALPEPAAAAAVQQIKDVAAAIRRRQASKKSASPVETSSRTRDAGPARKPKAKRGAPGVDGATPKKRAKPAAARSRKSKSAAKGKTSRRGSKSSKRGAGTRGRTTRRPDSR